MKVRRLQRLNGQDKWEDHGYAVAREDGQSLFRFNTLVWGRIGGEYNSKLKKAGTRLEDVHQVIPAKKRLRWLEIEEIEGEPEEIKARLDEACKIPRPQQVSVVKPVTA